jgi:YD repeat-containing protein
VQRSYDKGYRTASLSVNGLAIGYQYDADGAPTQAADLSLGYQPTSGLLANSILGTVNDSFGYNAFAELQSYSANIAATPLFQTSYARDALGRITTLTETITSTTLVYVYGYDPAGRLATVQRNGIPIASYSYDTNGNRLSATDRNDASNGSYDEFGNLITVTLPNTTTVISYLVDGKDRRIGRKLNGTLQKS